MLEFPKSCIKDVIIPKSRFKNHEDKFKSQIRQIRWKYVVDDVTSNYDLVDKLDTINVIEIKLKCDVVPRECLIEIDKVIPSNVIFELNYDDYLRYAFIYKSVYISKKFEEVKFMLSCKDIKTLYENLKRSILDDFTANETIEETIARIEKNKNIKKEIEKLELLIFKEKQPNKQLDMKLRIKNLKTKIDKEQNE